MNKKYFIAPTIVIFFLMLFFIFVNFNKKEPELCSSNNLDYYYSYGQWDGYDPDFFSKYYVGELDKISDGIEQDNTIQLIDDEPQYTSIFSEYMQQRHVTSGIRVVIPPQAYPVVYGWYMPRVGGNPIIDDKKPCGSKVDEPGVWWLMIFGLMILIMVRSQYEC